jgi:hypothetical protein
VIHRFRAAPVATLCYWLFVCTCFAVSIELLRRSLPSYLPHDWPNAHELDALADWKGARLYRLGINPYGHLGLSMLGQTETGHPPTTPFWYLPMIDFSKPLAAEISSLALWFLLVPHIYLCAKELNWPAPAAIAALGTSLAASTSWMHYHFWVVQLSEPIAFLYLLAWLFLRRGNDLSAGMCIGAAATMKLFPGLMMVMLLLSRRWRGFFAATVTYCSVVGMMTWTYGIESWFMFFAQQKPIANWWLGSLQNSSLSGLVMQVLYPFCHTAASPSKKATLITGVCAIVLIAVATWFSRRHIKRALDTDSRAIDLPFTLFALLSVFLNPWVWEHYYFLAIQPLFLLTTLFWQNFRVAFRKWSDGAFSPIGFPEMTCITAVAFAAVSFVLYALNRPIWIIGQYIDVWKRSSVSMYHWYAHFLQVLNFAPWIISIALCFVALDITRRLGIVAKDS